jgi:glycogenin glucosyltransferase
MREKLNNIWDEVTTIAEIYSHDNENLALLQRPELSVTFTKLHAWRLVQYSKCVFLDADTLVLTNIDDLFEREELSAAPDIGWPDSFNSGVFVYRPSLTTYSQLFDLAVAEGSYDGGDQGLLNQYWSNWSQSDPKQRLPFIYNVMANITYSYPPAFKRFSKDVKVIHFIGSVKPWHHHYNESDNSVVLYPGADKSQYGSMQYIYKWWDTYQSALSAIRQLTTSTDPHVFVPESIPVAGPDVQVNVSPAAGTVPVNVPVNVPSAVPPVNQVQSTPSQPVDVQSQDASGTVILTDDEKKTQWERGVPDYTGTDQFDNVMAHIMSRLT